jgi:hypothetical protein
MIAKAGGTYRNLLTACSFAVKKLVSLETKKDI